MSITETVLAIVEEYCRYGMKPAPEKTLRDLLLDDLDIIEISIAIEEKFGIGISDAELDAAQTVQDLIDIVPELGE
jgi:acyl carrier protein